MTVLRSQVQYNYAGRRKKNTKQRVIGKQNKRPDIIPRKRWRGVSLLLNSILIKIHCAFMHVRWCIRPFYNAVNSLHFVSKTWIPEILTMFLSRYFSSVFPRKTRKLFLNCYVRIVAGEYRVIRRQFLYHVIKRISVVLFLILIRNIFKYLCTCDDHLCGY